MESPLINKSLDFATQIVLFYENYSKSKKETTIAKQLLRSATSIGANFNEAIYGNSKADFISKLHISLKETSESIYWLKLLSNTNLIEYNYNILIDKAEEIKRMLIASINTAKENKWDYSHIWCEFCRNDLVVYSIIQLNTYKIWLLNII